LTIKSSLGSDHQSLVLPIEHDILRPKHDIAENLQVASPVALHATEASLAVDLRKRDLSSGNDGRVA
jgi:hypothetical protein